MDLIKDKLTGFYTEEFLKDGVEREIIRAERYKRELSFLLVKFDVPEKYRSDMFLAVLKRIAREIDAHTRKLDLKIRMGVRMANKVLIVLPETDEQGALKVAEKIKETVANVDFFHAISAAAFKIVIQVAIGTYPRDGVTINEILTNLNRELG